MKNFAYVLFALCPIAMTTPVAYADEPVTNMTMSITEHGVIEDPVPAHPAFEFEVGSTQTVFSDTVNVRANPFLGGEVLDTLALGQRVKILAVSKPVLKIGNRASQWYLVGYQKNGKRQQGFVWGGKLAFDRKRLDGHDILFGALPSLNADDIDVTIKVLRNGDLKQKEVFSVYSYDFSPRHNFEWRDGQGLSGVTHLLFFHVFGEGCGIPSTTEAMAWTGSEFVKLPTIMSVSDAGYFYHNESYVFPANEGGKPNRVTIRTEYSETDEEYGDYNEPTVTELHYGWDNGKLILPK